MMEPWTGFFVVLGVLGAWVVVARLLFKKFVENKEEGNI